ncbi:hypothetical protein [Kutzneria sp. CA-103260]|uniref:hypothetical protein n=1 Tax=Kutzneria sp. CA-103260 TaxID=2802641 RepID=UPI001BA7A285|nr:hypothetical protein [Kutzneria sp. CA-103260]QUQ68535.1 hypothetical protein JJ691_62810 [Kutzneria sp. CA-103260]
MERELSPAESLALIEGQRAEMRRRRGVRPELIAFGWGLAYLLGFGGWYLALQGVVPAAVAGVVLGVFAAIALVLPIVLGVRASRGVRGPSRTIGAMYGTAWGLAFAANSVVQSALQQQMKVSPEVSSLMWASSSLLVVGLMYLAGAMLWRDVSQYVLGAWMLASAAGSVLAGVPGNFLVLAFAGGGGMLALSAYYVIRR